MPPLSNLLVADKEEMICSIVEEAFQERPDIHVECAYSGDDAANKLCTNQYDLAVLAAVMPVLDGLELAEIAVKNGIPVLLIVAHPEYLTRVETVGLPHLAKPFRLADLLAHIDAVARNPESNLRQVRTSLALMKRAGAAKARRSAF